MKNKFKTAVLGQYNIEKYSLSPLIHNYFFKQANINGEYSAIPVEVNDLGNTLKILQKEGYTGVNLTIPHKINALKYVTKLDKSAEVIGAINTIIFNNNEAIGYNTDCFGFIENLNKTINNWNQTNKEAIIFGAGGASHAIIYGLQNAGIKNITICNRTNEKAKDLSKYFNCNFVKWEDRQKSLLSKTLIINTTSAGMNNNPPLDISLLNVDNNSIIYDIVYKPKNTLLINQAIELKNKNFKIVYGIGMLLYQAARAFDLWFGIEPTIDKKLIDIIDK